MLHSTVLFSLYIVGGKLKGKFKSLIIPANKTDLSEEKQPEFGDIKAFRFIEKNEIYERGNGAVVCTNDSVVPLSEKDSIVPFYYI